MEEKILERQSKGILMFGKNVSEEYGKFVANYGVISQDGIEIYGARANLDENLLPSAVAATKLYKKEYHLNDTDIVISFDDFLNCPVILDDKNCIYNVYLDRREKQFDSFNEWFDYIKTEYELDI